ncbi:MAG: hypothetical protein J0L93_05990 [Deltaproteobacteria bacterium]|nr:hypothetical protein [Deltaproteobacteria bacterium]
MVWRAFIFSFLFFSQSLWAFDSQTSDTLNLENSLIQSMHSSELELSKTDISYIRHLVRFFQIVGWPNADSPVWAVHADSHGYNDTYREALRQGALMQKLIGHYHEREIVMKTLHIGDVSDGVNINQVAETLRIPEEFGVEYRNRYVVGGNNEWGGFTSHDFFTQNQWRQSALHQMRENAVVVKSPRAKYGEFKPLADNEVGYLEMWPGFTLAVAHKPPTELAQNGFLRTKDESTAALHPFWGGVNLRNWVGAPVTFMFAYLPGVFLLNVIPVKVNSVFLGSDIWRPVWSTAQTALDITKFKIFSPEYREHLENLMMQMHDMAIGRAFYMPPALMNLIFQKKLTGIFNQDYRIPTFFKKSGTYFVRDDASLSERVHRRIIGNFPRWDSETLATTRYITPIPSDVTALHHGHTHRTYHAISGIPDKKMENQFRLVTGSPPTYEDANVPQPAFGWVSYIDINGIPWSSIHDGSKGGKIVSSLPAADLKNSPIVREFYEKNGVDINSGIVPRGPIFCQRILGKLSGLKGGMSEKFKEFSRSLGVSGQSK